MIVFPLCHELGVQSMAWYCELLTTWQYTNTKCFVNTKSQGKILQTLS
ncbi:MAG: hypothetical protein LBG21_03015 [Campylobacteraceae bacterium]|nr:hypothetical protein [Campylobacteraceae bacterium]